MNRPNENIPNEELNSKLAMIKKDIFLEMEIIKERIKDKEKLGENYTDIINLSNYLLELREIKDHLRPF